MIAPIVLIAKAFITGFCVSTVAAIVALLLVRLVYIPFVGL